MLAGKVKDLRKALYTAKLLYMQCYTKTEQEAQQWKPYWFFNAAVTGYHPPGYQQDLIGLAPTSVQRKWIVDSGSCFDLVNKGELSLEDQRAMRPTPYPIEMQTANGDVTAHHELAVVIDRLDMDIHAIVMDDAPTVLSLGKRCMEDGYEFHWEP